MGRWATYRRRGGGPPPPVSLNFIEVAEVSMDTVIHVTYRDNITAALFDTADFFTNPSSIQPDTITQFDVDTLQLDMPISVATETGMTYIGDVPGIETPQTLDLS